MYKKILLYLFSILSSAAFAQNQGYYATEFWKKYTEALTFDLKLEPLAVKSAGFHFRLWDIGQVIDIWKDNSSIIYGEITNYAKEYDEMNLGKRTFYHSTQSIKSAIAADIYQLILNAGLTSMPNGEAIKGWQKSAVGFTYITECIDSGKYSYKCYLSPDKQGSLQEAIAIQSFITKISQILKLKKTYKSFSASIPFWCYTKGTQEVACRKK
jgi:hypothetical protein